MPKIRFVGTWSSFWQKEHQIPRGFLLIKYKNNYRKSLGTVLMKLDDYQEKKHKALIEKGEQCVEDDYLQDLEFDLEYHYRKRNLDQNALMWSLYEIESNEMNGGQKGHKDQTVKAMDLYLADLEEWGERETITTRRKNLSYYLDEYKIIEAVVLDNAKEMSVQDCIKINMDSNDRITLRVIRGTSKLNTKEMAQWIDRIFNRMAYNGVQVTNPGDIENYWLKWKQHINDNKIVIHDTIMTQKEYKDFNPICEACGKFIGNGTGELAHIKAVGMGGNYTNEPYKNYSSNWLHLCSIPCHREIWHGKGVKQFLKEFRHLVYKVNTALNRDYDDIIKEGEAVTVEPTKDDSIKKVKDLYASGKIDKDEACLQLNKLGGDPYEINPDWIGMF